MNRRINSQQLVIQDTENLKRLMKQRWIMTFSSVSARRPAQSGCSGFDRMRGNTAAYDHHQSLRPQGAPTPCCSRESRSQPFAWNPNPHELVKSRKSVFTLVTAPRALTMQSSAFTANLNHRDPVLKMEGHHRSQDSLPGYPRGDGRSYGR